MSEEQHENQQQETQSNETPAPKVEEKTSQKGGKPVITYIMILFIAAFLMMALSFLMHQRSNSEALGELQSSVTAIQEVQAHQEEILDLQTQLTETEKELESLQKTSAEELEEQKQALDAMMQLYLVQQAYSKQNYEECAKLIQQMEENGIVEHLPESPVEDFTNPAERFQQFKDAVNSILVLGS